MHPIQIPPAPYRQPPESEEARRYFTHIRGLEARIRELEMEKARVVCGFLELRFTAARTLKEKSGAEASERRAVNELYETTCELQIARSETASYKEMLEEELGPLNCPQSWRNLVQENNRLKEEVQRLQSNQ